MRTQTSVKSYGGLREELSASPFLDPAEMAMAMEERFLAPQQAEEEIQLETLTMPLLERYDKQRLQRQFGKWLPKSADKLIREARAETLKATDGCPSVADNLASLCSVISRIESIEKWKEEQRKVRRATQHYLKEETAKDKDTRKWVDAKVYEMPPLMLKMSNGIEAKFFKASEARAIQAEQEKAEAEAKPVANPWEVVSSEALTHEPARYAIKLPDGTIVDLGMTQGNFKPVTRTNPAAAMQSIASRLDISMRGGDCEILRHLLGRTDIIPAYTTVWHRAQWLVLVGWQADPKTSTGDNHRVAPKRETSGPLWQNDPMASSDIPSQGGHVGPFYKDENGELTRKPQAEEEPLTLSELDYHLLCESSDLGIEDENGNIVDYMNEEEEFLSFMPQREQEDHAVDLTRFAEDDPEMELFQFLMGHVERSENCITLGDVACPAATMALEGELVDDDKGGTKWMHGLNGAKHNLKTFLYIHSQEPTDELAKTIAFWQGQVERFERMIATRETVLESHSDSMVRYWIPNERNRMMKMASARFMKEPVKMIPGASISPANSVPAAKLKHADSLPEHRTSTLQRVVRGRVNVLQGAQGPVSKFVPALKAKPLSARNAPEALKARIRKMIADELESNPYAAVQKAFAEAFEAALNG